MMIVGTKSAWTPERRARQAEIIRKTKPWLKSTGPKTEEGKAISSRNALMHPNIRALRQQLKGRHTLPEDFELQVASKWLLWSIWSK